MSNLAVISAAIEKALMAGDLSDLSGEQRISYYNAVCASCGLNPLTKPFDFIKLNGKLVMYATKNCAEQLRRIHGISLKIVSRELISGVYVVTAQAKTADGREDESTGAVPTDNLKGEMLANAYMKCETKAKRRVTLSICGLGMLDESEIESIPKEAIDPNKKLALVEGENDLREKAIDELLGKFAKLGVSAKQIGKRYELAPSDTLTDDQINDLNRIGRLIVSSKDRAKTISEIFKSNEPQYEEF